MSCVNMLERARNCESSDMVAETMPHAQKTGDRGVGQFLHENAEDLVGLIESERDR